MATRSIFHHTESPAEQSLHEDLIQEAIQIYGQDLYYLPKTVVNIDGLFGEDAGSTTFEEAYPIEMYVKNVEGFEGEGDFLQQFGLEIRDQTTFTVARKRFDDLELNISQPKEGDLIWFTLINTMYKIQYVESEAIFYQLGQLPVFDIQCELFDFQGEVFNTGIQEIDDFGRRITPSTEFDLDPSGSGTFIVGENVYQGDVADPTFTAKVKEFDSTNFTVTLTNTTGVPSSSFDLIGEDSGATWIVDLGTTSEEQYGMEQSGGDNWDIEEEADNWIDFQEENPFGSF